MDNDNLEKYENFRQICIQNAEDFLNTAESLLGKNVNHICFHLATLSMEEVGKLDLVWFQMMSDNRLEDKEINLATDDHIKKLFWAIWGHSFGSQKITKEQIDERKNMATFIHNRRLFSLYTETTDTVPSKEKISNQECEQFVTFARAGLELAKLRKFEPLPREDLEVINWWLQANEDSEQRKLIWGHKSQDKLIELGNVREWIKWLKATFDKNDAELKEMITKELQRQQPKGKEKEKPKFRVKLKIITPSHSIKNKLLHKFNEGSNWIKLYKGADNHTLIVEITFSKNMPTQLLWDRGWIVSRMFVASLNAATGGLFWWNTPVDTARYYEEIWDLESNIAVFVDLNPRLQMNWRELRWTLGENELRHTSLVFGYLVRIMDSGEFEPIRDYMNGLAMLAKNDVHLRLEHSALDMFFEAFRKALLINNDWQPDKENMKDVAYNLIQEALPHRQEFDKLMDMAAEQHKLKEKYSKPITLPDAIGFKHYFELYLIKLAARKMTGAKDVRLVTEKSAKAEADSRDTVSSTVG